MGFISTDMYNNRSIFKAWSELHMKLINEQNAIRRTIYTGCTSSIIPRKIPFVYSISTRYLKSRQNLFLLTIC